ncbi:MAG: hypothetical protein EXR93_09965 [Gemmatimonadetes bacterium]|nr:hypothetical protein [Gemmatimonadota bacterium]
MFLATPFAPLRGQSPFPVPAQRPDSSQFRDTVKVPQFRIQPPISPMSAVARSLVLPGWGQAVLGRRVTGAMFVFWEGVSLTMMLKSVHRLDYLKSTGSDKVAAKRQEVQDWAVLLAFNHLLAGAEAYVSAQLWDFPVDLDVRSLPHGMGAGITLPLP